MPSRLSIDTGAPRSVQGHIVSGALTSFAIAGVTNYNAYKKGEYEKKEAILNTAKLTLQGAIATSSAIAAANYLGQGSIFKMFGAVCVGVAGVYAVEKIDEKVNIKQTQLTKG